MDRSLHKIGVIGSVNGNFVYNSIFLLDHMSLPLIFGSLNGQILLKNLKIIKLSVAVHFTTSNELCVVSLNNILF